MTRSTALIPFLVTAIACGGGKEIDDPALQASGATLGEQSAALVELEATADDGAVQGQTQMVGSTLQTIVSQHQAYSAGGASAAAGGQARSQARQTTPDDPVSWDGSELCIDFTYAEGGVDVSYQVEFDITSDASGGSVDGTYDLDYTVSAGGFGTEYRINAVYDQLTTDASGCTVAGSVTIDYDLSVVGAGIPGAAGDQSGRVTITYNACDDVTVTGT